MSKYDTRATAKLAKQFPSCGQENWRILRKQNLTNGAMVYPYCCRHCGYRSAICESRLNALTWLADYGLDTDALKWAGHID